MALPSPEDTPDPVLPIEDEPPPSDQDEVEVEPAQYVESIEYDEDDPNLVPIFAAKQVGRDFLKKFVTLALDEFDKAWSSTEEWRERKKADYRIFSGDLPKKTYPWEGSANPHLPLMMQNLLRLDARITTEFFGNWNNVFQVLPIGIGPEQEARARIMTKHDNWQIRHQITDFRRQMHRAVLLYFTHGDVTAHSFYDTIRRRNQHELLTPDEFVIPYTLVTTEPDYSDVPFKCKILYRYRHDIQRMRGEWHDVDAVLKRKAPSWEDDPAADYHQAATEVEGIEVPTDSEYTPFKLIEWTGYVDFPKNVEPGMQDKQRYVKAVIDYGSHTIVELSIHEEPDWRDVARFNAQQDELNRYREARLVWDNEIIPARKKDMDFDMRYEQGLVDPKEAEQIYSMRAAQPLPAEAPPAPEWMFDPDDPDEEPPPVRKVALQMYTHGVCIDNLTGNLGLGLGRIQADLNRNANLSLSQFADAAHLSNSSSLITSDVDFDGDFVVAPGRVNKTVGLGGSDLRQKLYELKFNPANPQLVTLAQMMHQYGESSVQAPEVLSGGEGKSGETYRGKALQVEQATKQLSWYAMSFSEFFEHIMKNNAALNYFYLEDEQIIRINESELRVGEQITVSAEMYAQDYQIEIRADMKFTAQAQKVSSADELVAMSMNIPELQTNSAFRHAAVVKALRAREQYDMIEKLGQPPPPPPQFSLPLPPMPPPGGPPGGGGPPPPAGAP